MFNNLTEVRKEMEPRLFRTIHREAVQAVKEIKTKELKLIRILQEVDENFVYRYFEFDSLYQYCLHALDLTEAQSMMYISVARKSKQLPALQRALESGEVTVSKVKRVVPVINNENQEHWLELVQHSSKRVIEKEVAKVNPRAVHPERTRYLTDTVMELRTPLSEEVFELVKRAQEVISQKSRKPMKMEDVIEVLANYYLKNEDPIEREKRREVKAQKKAKAIQDKEQIAALSPCPGTVTQETLQSAVIKTADIFTSQSSSDREENQVGHQNEKTQTNSRFHSASEAPIKSKPIKRTTKDKVLRRDGGRCTYRHGNRQCTERIFLHAHHVLHREHGGTNDTENLITLCSAHHQIVHDGFH